MYTHLEPEEYQVDNDGKSVKKVSVCVDTASDIPTPDPDWSQGSSCLILDTQEIKFLNSQGEWV